MNKEIDKVHILLVNNDSNEVESIKTWLTQDMRVPWSVTHCVKVAEVVSRSNKADLIILKPEMEGLSSPEQVFKSIEGMAFEIPIIVLTSEGDTPKLSTYVMEQGAADTIIRGQFARLVDAIEFALIRQRITTQARITSEQNFSDNHEKNMTEKERHRQILRMFSGEYAFDQSNQ